MKKFVLFLTCSAFAVSSAQAMNAAEHLNAVKDIFAQEFQKIDLDGNGAISADEYMLYQLNVLQQSLNAETQKTEAEAAALGQAAVTEQEAPKTEEPKAETPRNLDTMGSATATLEEMANFSLDTSAETAAEPDMEDDEWYLKPEKLTMEDVMPEDENAAEDVPEIDLSISEDESLRNILADMAKAEAKSEETPAVEEKNAVASEKETKQIQFMLDTIKKTLPKKIDNITTWTDISFKDNEIDYIYKADVDMNKFSTAEKAALKENIEKVACAQAYAEMCPTMKPMFIDKGVNMKIRYYDKADIEISDCTFNNETCK